METRNSAFWYSPGGVVLLLGCIVIIVFAGFLAYRPLSRAWWIGRLTDEDPDVAANARYHILAMGKHAAPALADMLLESADIRKRTSAAELLDELGYHEVTRTFWIERLLSGDAEPAAAAKKHLVAMGETAVESVKRLLGSPESRRRFAAYEVCLDMKRPDIVPHEVKIDHLLHKADFPRGRIRLGDFVSGKRFGDITVVAPPGLANESFEIPEDVNASYIEAALRRGYDAVLSGSVLCFAEEGQLDIYRKAVSRPRGEPRDYEGKEVWRKVREQKIPVGMLSQSLKEILDNFEAVSGLNFVLDPMALGVEPISLREGTLAGDVLLDIITLPRGLAWHVMGGAVVVYEPTRLSECFELTEIEESWREEYGDIVNALESRTVSLHFQETPLSVVLNLISDISGLNIFSLPGANVSELVILHVKEVKLAHALDYILKVNCGYRWRVSDEAIVVSAAPGFPKKPFAVPALDAAAKNFPRLVGIIRSKELSFQFEEVFLDDAASYLRDISGIDIFLEPVLYAEPPTVSIRVDDMDMKSALTIISRYTGCRWDVRYGGVFIAQANVIEEIPRSIKLPADLPKRLVSKLDLPVSFEFKERPLEQITDFLNEVELPISIGRRARADRGADGIKVTITVRELKMRYALEAILLPIGLSWRLKNGKIVIVPRGAGG